MTMSTLERAYLLVVLKDRLKADGCRAVDALLAPRSVRDHLAAICAAASKASQSS